MPLEPMKITGYQDENYGTLSSEQPYTFMINPDSVKWNRRIEYAEEQAPGTSAPSQRYKYTPNDTLNFDIVIDCTGIVDNTRLDMNKEIKSLEEIMFTRDGEIHRPNYLVIRWGKNFVFSGVLTSFDTSYTLFDPNGNALRAKISLGFSQYISPQKRKKKDKDSSPDVSHMVNVEEGTSLPQLCNKVWNNDDYTVQVAKFNDLNKFRNLSGIRKLIFPPIITVS